ncbi:MAG: SsrA-binding protein SmpB [Chloroflexi bacterium]|nr:SsrA-binding protein SmpB [Chloroflexota bacterium]
MPKAQKQQEPVRGGNRLIARNRKAYHDYHIEDTLEAGIVLTGSEIKSIRAGRVNLRDSYVAFRNGEAWLVGAHIAGYASASYQDHDPNRDRKLLLHRREIERWRSRVDERGYTVVPLSLYLKNNRAKVEIGLARGKRQYDKREAIRERETDRAVQRGIREAMREKY